MKIEFELTNLQEKAFTEILSQSDLKDKTLSEAANILLIRFIIQGKQKLSAEQIAKELS